MAPGNCSAWKAEIAGRVQPHKSEWRAAALGCTAGTSANECGTNRQIRASRGRDKGIGEDGIRTRGKVLPLHRFSKPALSATQPPLQAIGIYRLKKILLASAFSLLYGGGRHPLRAVLPNMCNGGSAVTEVY